MTIDRFRTLGRIAGAEVAGALVDAMAAPGADKAAIATIGDAAIRAQMDRLRAEGASSEEVAAFTEAADRRYGEMLAEIMLQAELGMLAGKPPSGLAH